MKVSSPFALEYIDGFFKCFLHLASGAGEGFRRG